MYKSTVNPLHRGTNLGLVSFSETQTHSEFPLPSDICPSPFETGGLLALYNINSNMVSGAENLA